MLETYDEQMIIIAQDLAFILPEPTVVERRYYDRARLPQNVPIEPISVFDLSQKLIFL